MNRLEEIAEKFDAKYPKYTNKNNSMEAFEVTLNEKIERYRIELKKFFLDSCVEYAHAHLFIKDVDTSAGECILEIRSCIEKDIKTLNQ